jgi:hypothetical protein
MNESNKELIAAAARELAAAAQDLRDEEEAQLSEYQRVMGIVVRDILKLERDMTQPGSSVSESSRIDRLAKFVQERTF